MPGGIVNSGHGGLSVHLGVGTFSFPSCLFCVCKIDGDSSQCLQILQIHVKVCMSSVRCTLSLLLFSRGRHGDQGDEIACLGPSHQHRAWVRAWSPSLCAGPRSRPTASSRSGQAGRAELSVLIPRDRPLGPEPALSLPSPAVLRAKACRVVLCCVMSCRVALRTAGERCVRQPHWKSALVPCQLCHLGQFT